jgi:hypothetical protein
LSFAGFNPHPPLLKGGFLQLFVSQKFVIGFTRSQNFSVIPRRRIDLPKVFWTPAFGSVISGDTNSSNLLLLRISFPKAFLFIPGQLRCARGADLAQPAAVALLPVEHQFDKLDRPEEDLPSSPSPSVDTFLIT